MLTQTSMPAPQYWVDKNTIPWPVGVSWLLGFRNITVATNARTMIAAAVPFAGIENNLPLLMPNSIENNNTYNLFAPLILANLILLFLIL